MNRKNFIQTTMAAAALMSISPCMVFGYKRKDTPGKKLHLVGVGGAGANVIDYARSVMEIDARYSCINRQAYKPVIPEITCLNYSIHDQYIMHGQENVITRDKFGNYTSGYFNSDETIILVAGFGRETGTYASVHLFGILKTFCKDVYLVASTPFSYEGAGAAQRADAAIKQLGTDKNVAYIFSGEFRRKYGNMPYNRTFDTMDRVVMERAMEFVNSN